MKPYLRLPFNIVLASSLLLGLVACQKSEPAQEMTESAAAPEPAAPATTPSAPEISLETLDQKVSYGIGRNIGNDISGDSNIKVDIDALVAGLRDSVNGGESRMSDEEIRTAFGEIRARAQEAQAAKAAGEQQRSMEFLAANGARAEVTTTASGLQYEIMTAGTGATPTAADRVKVHYHGTLADGTVFDSSVQRGEPIEFPVTGVIPGWVEALQLMPTGSKWKLAIPPALGYGDNGSGMIPGGAALIFEVELLEVMSPAAPAAE